MSKRNYLEKDMEASKIARHRFVKEIKEREKLDKPIRSKAKEYMEKWLRKFSDEIQDTEHKRTISHFRSIIHGVNIQQVLSELRDLEKNKIKGERLLTAVKELISKYNLEEKYKRKKEWRESIKEPPHILCGLYLKGLKHQQTT